MQGGNKARSISALFRHLSTKWPAAFNPQAPRPLKFGIHNELRDRESELSDEELKRALRAYTKIDKYLPRCVLARFESTSTASPAAW